MGVIGDTLSEARTRRAVDLDEVHAATGIRPRYLRAIEQEDWDALPEEFYARSFIRKYAQFLGVDPDPLVDEYRRQRGTAAPRRARRPRPSPGPRSRRAEALRRRRKRQAVYAWVGAAAVAGGDRRRDRPARRRAAGEGGGDEAAAEAAPAAEGREGRRASRKSGRSEGGARGASPQPPAKAAQSGEAGDRTDRRSLGLRRSTRRASRWSTAPPWPPAKRSARSTRAPTPPPSATARSTVMVDGKRADDARTPRARWASPSTPTASSTSSRKATPKLRIAALLQHCLN